MRWKSQARSRLSPRLLFKLLYASLCYPYEHSVDPIFFFSFRSPYNVSRTDLKRFVFISHYIIASFIPPALSSGPFSLPTLEILSTSSSLTMERWKYHCTFPFSIYGGRESTVISIQDPFDEIIKILTIIFAASFELVNIFIVVLSFLISIFNMTYCM